MAGKKAKKRARRDEQAGRRAQGAKAQGAKAQGAKAQGAKAQAAKAQAAKAQAAPRSAKAKRVSRRGAAAQRGVEIQVRTQDRKVHPGSKNEGAARQTATRQVRAGTRQTAENAAGRKPAVLDGPAAAGQTTPNSKLRTPNSVAGGAPVGGAARAEARGSSADGQGARAAPAGDAYGRHRERQRERQAQASETGREIGELPAVLHPERRAACLPWTAAEPPNDGLPRGIERFCLEYFPDTFCLPFAEDHRRVFRTVEQIAVEDGLFALAMPRGTGKTSIVLAAVIWVTFFGFRRFAVVVGAEAGHGRALLESILTTLETNEPLQEDFPEILYPIVKLERINQRAKGQLYRGEPTRISIRADRIVLPTLKRSADDARGGADATRDRRDADATHATHAIHATGDRRDADAPQYTPASGAVICATSILAGAGRGKQHVTADGRTLRPDFLLIDDPQTDESARSIDQCRKRLRVLNHTVPGLAGPGKKIAAVATVTVICKGDVADQLLDQKRNPQWHGQRTKLLPQRPTNKALWDEHRSRWMAGHAAGEKFPAAAHEFYVAHQAALDEGALVSWEHRKGPLEASAIEHAMCLLWEYGEAGFAAEFQNEPLDEEKADEELQPDEILLRTNGLPRRVPPANASRLTAFIDVQGAALYYLVAAWTEQFGGCIIDYGTEPEQTLRYFTLRQIEDTLAARMPGAALEAAIRGGLERLVNRLAAATWRRADGGEMSIEQITIDAAWGTSTDTVFDFCRATPHKAIVLPSMGKGLGPADKPLSEYEPRPNERSGNHWRLSVNTRGVRFLTIDTNYWKTFNARRLAAPLGDPGALTLWGEREQRERHRLLADHLCAEQGATLKHDKTGRETTIWKCRPNRDNHWWDCLTGCAAGASFRGLVIPGTVAPVAKRGRVSWAARQQQAKREQGGA